VSASSVFNASYTAWNAFDQQQNNSNSADCWASADYAYDSAGNGNEWIMIDLGSVKTIVSYILRARGGADINNARSTFASAFAMSVSTDGVNFTQVDTRSNLPPVTAFYQPFSFTLATPVQARFVKWTITKITHTQALFHAAIGEIELQGY
jgi:hypothetical protein